MKNVFLIMGLMLTLRLPLAGQTTDVIITGRILTTEGQAVPDVNVYASRIGAQYEVYASCLSDEAGGFRLTYRATADSICLHVSGFNIAPATVVCANRSHHRDIAVQEKVQQLREVTVKAPKLYTRGDTLNYSVASFRSQSDLSIAQVLKRLPGIQVSEVGEISYKGQPIKNFYIEGLDLMKGRYGIATNNIDPGSISTVQVLENHQDVKALRDLKPEERASINLKLRSGVKGVFNLIATIGAGSDGASLWDNELIAILFRRNSQLLATYKGNNTGHDLADELRSFDDSGLSRTSNVTEIALPATPGIDKRYYYDNRTHAATYNNVYRTKGEGELGINAAYLTDRDRRANESHTTALLPDGSKNLVEELFEGRVQREQWWGTLAYLQNNEHLYLKEQLRLEYATSQGHSDIYAGQTVTQSNRVSNYRLHNLLHLTRRTGTERGVEFLSKLNIERRPHSLDVSPNLFPEAVEGAGLHQAAGRRNLSTDNRLEWLAAWVWGGWQLHPALFLNYACNDLTSLLGTHRNDLRLHTLHTGVGVTGTYRHGNLYADLYLTGAYRHTRLTHRDTRVGTGRHHLLPEPRLSLKYKWNGGHEVRLSGSLSHAAPAIENLYDRYLLTSYRTLSLYESEGLYHSTVQQYNLAYDYKSVVTMFFLGGDIGYTHHRPDVLYGNSYDGIAERLTARPTDETSQLFSLTLRGSKGFEWSRLKVGAECRYTHFDSPMLVQEEVVRYRGSTFRLKVDADMAPAEWLLLAYEGGAYRSAVRMKGGGSMPVLRTLTQRASIRVQLPAEVSVEVALSHYHNNLNRGDRSFLLGEASARYRYKRLTFSLTCDNLLDRRQYAYTASTGLTESSALYPVRPRSLLLKVRCRLF